MVAAMDAAPDRSVDAGGILGAMSAAKESPVSAETELVERARAGDRQAFDRLTEMHLPRVWRVVWGVLRHREDTEDIVQEVFLTAYRSLPDYRGECSLSTWLHRIAVTRALNHLDLAAEKVRRSSLPIEPSWEDPDPGSSSPDPPRDVRPTPLQALEANDLMRRLSECLGRLPSVWRAVISLRDAEELSYEEIAGALGLNIGTVRSRLARGRLALRDCVEGPRS